MTDRPLVILAEPIDESARCWLADRVDLHELPSTDPGFGKLLTRAEGMVIRTATRVDSDLLDRAPMLRVVARAGVGLDGVDLEACRDRGVRVLNTPDANTQAVVEFVISAVTGVLRPRDRVTTALQPDEWAAMRAPDRAAIQMDELTFGVLGFGRIGSRVARVASAIGFDVIYHDLLDINAADRGSARPVDRGTLLDSSDVLSIHVDGRPENLNLLGPDEIRRLGDESVLVNTSRGLVIDESALANRLRESDSLTAILDVHALEPIPDESPLLGLANAILHPHIAARTRTGLRAMSWVVRDLVQHLSVRESSPI